MQVGLLLIYILLLAIVYGYHIAVSSYLRFVFLIWGEAKAWALCKEMPFLFARKTRCWRSVYGILLVVIFSLFTPVIVRVFANIAPLFTCRISFLPWLKIKLSSTRTKEFS